jgi:hypothetical protein
MFKKSTVFLAILALLAFGACTCWGYTVGKWPVPGIPNTVYSPGGPLMPGQYQMTPYQTPMYNPMYNYGMQPYVNPYPGGAFGYRSFRPY